MKKLIIALIVLITIGLSSCTEEELIERRKNRIEGTWEFDKAVFREKWELFGDDMMYHFEGDLITFFDNGTAVYDDFQLRELYDGNWGVDLEYEYDYEGDEERVYFLDMEFYDPSNEDFFGYYAEIRFQTNKTLRISAWNDRGEYKFKLKKQ